MLKRVIITQNVTFDKDTLYLKEFKQVISQLLEIIDTKSIFKNNKL